MTTLVDAADVIRRGGTGERANWALAAALAARRPVMLAGGLRPDNVVDAMRALWLGVPAGNNVWCAVVWCLVLIAIFAPLAVRKYRRTAGR